MPGVQTKAAAGRRVRRRAESAGRPRGGANSCLAGTEKRRRRGERERGRFRRNAWPCHLPLSPSPPLPLFFSCRDQRKRHRHEISRTEDWLHIGENHQRRLATLLDERPADLFAVEERLERWPVKYLLCPIGLDGRRTVEL